LLKIANWKRPDQEGSCLSFLGSGRFFAADVQYFAYRNTFAMFAGLEISDDEGG
jgi:hypothetical protein